MRVIENERLQELAELANQCAGTMGTLTIDEAIVVLGLINFIGIDGKKELYKTISKSVVRLYPVLQDLLEADEA